MTDLIKSEKKFSLRPYESLAPFSENLFLNSSLPPWRLAFLGFIEPICLENIEKLASDFKFELFSLSAGVVAKLRGVAKSRDVAKLGVAACQAAGTRLRYAGRAEASFGIPGTSSTSLSWVSGWHATPPPH